MMKIGIIGCGKIAQVRHIPEYAANADCELYGFYDVDRERAREVAAPFGGKVYDSAEELLRDPAIDAVSVCAANYAHAQLSIEAMRAGKHVLCEKPMAVTLQECELMVYTAKKTGKLLMIGMNQRLTRTHEEARRMIARGEIGRILTFRTTFGHGGPESWSITPGKKTWFFNSKKAAMGAMADLGVHKTDLIQYLTGQNVVETTAKVVTLDKRDEEGNLIGVDDNAICIYTLSGGAVGTMSASWTYYGAEDNATTLYGTEGIMKIYEDPDHSIVIIRPDGTRTNHDLDVIQTNDRQTGSGVIDAFVQSIRGEKQDAISGESVVTAMRAVFASIRSAQMGESIRIPENEGR